MEKLNYPISEIKFLANEKLLWSKGQGTFHRSYDWHFAITNQRTLIFYRTQIFQKPQWFSFDLLTIQQIEIYDLSFSPLWFWSKWMTKSNTFPRTQVIIITQKEATVFNSDNDEYQEERQFDRKLVLAWAKELSCRNIRIKRLNNE